jgi:hypothetical protein
VRCPTTARSAAPFLTRPRPALIALSPTPGVADGVPDTTLAAHFQHAYVTITTPFPQWRRLQEAILASPMGVSRLMDMMLEREVIRNEALLLLIFLTRSAEEIQKIVVFEGAFERLFKIVTEEGGSDGGIIVQDCLELLNNLLRNNPSNQVR